jgi:hypothetical protein
MGKGKMGNSKFKKGKFWIEANFKETGFLTKIPPAPLNKGGEG